MGNIIRRPLIATLSIMLCSIGAILLILVVCIGIIDIQSLDPSVYGEVAVDLIASISILIGTSLLYKGRYRIGGALSLVSAIYFFIIFIDFPGPYYMYNLMSFLPLLGGFLGLVSNEDIVSLVSSLTKLYGRIKVSDLSAKLGKNESEVELAIIELQSKGENIRIDDETREVIYQEVPPPPPPER